MERTTGEYYNYLIDNNYFTSEELDLITSINGYDTSTLDDCLYARYGYHDLGQMLGEDEEDEEDEEESDGE